MLKALLRILFGSKKRSAGTMMGAIIVIGGGSVYVTPGGGPSTANIWVNTSAGASPSRCAPACAYDSTHAYASLDAAYDAATAGDTVAVKCGSYGLQTLSGNLVAGPQVVFAPETDYCATLGGIWSGSSSGGSGGGAYSTFQNFTITKTDDVVVYKGAYASSAASHIYILHNHINVGTAVTGQIVYSGGNADYWHINYNTIGPACCSTGTDSPEGIRLGVDAAGHENDHVEIIGNVIQGVVRDTADYPSTYITVESPSPQSAGSAPGSTCGGCHGDGIHIFGLRDSTISGNRIYNNAVQGIFLEPTNNSLNADLVITNNMIATNPGDTNKCGICINSQATDSIGGAWTIGFNTVASADQITINNSSASGAASTTVFTIIGNIGPLYIVPNGGPSACQGFADSDVSAVYSYNAWVTQGGATNQTCGTGDVYPFTPGFTAGTSTLFDLHLSGAAGSADSLVVAAACTAISTVDIDAETRPRDTNCDAGADERHT